MISLIALLFAQVCAAPCTCSCPEVPPTPPPPAVGIESVCKGKIAPLAKPYLWKPESQGMTDARKDLPGLIDSTHTAKWKTLDVFATNGAKVGTVGYYGTFKGASSSRFYSGCCGGSKTTARQMAERASAQTGSPNVFIELTSGGCAGPFRPTDRVGGY